MPNIVGVFIALTALSLIGYANDSGCHALLHDTLDEVSVHQESILVGLVQVGYQHHVCLGIENPDAEILTRRVSVDSRSLSVGELVQQMLPPGRRYTITEENGVVLIRGKEPVVAKSWLDEHVPSFEVPRASVQEVSNALYMTIAMLADPSIQGFAGTHRTGDPGDKVGPISEHGRTLRELLNVILIGSGGGTWISSTCSRADSEITQRPCWTTIQYTEPLSSVLQLANIVVDEHKQKSQAPRK